VDCRAFTFPSACDETYVTAKDRATTKKPMVFYAKWLGLNGITKKLMRVAQQDPIESAVKVFIDGPYGGHDRRRNLLTYM
jgi:hypothetical protein